MRHQIKALSSASLKVVGAHLALIFSANG